MGLRSVYIGAVLRCITLYYAEDADDKKDIKRKMKKSGIALAAKFIKDRIKELLNC